MDDMTVQNNSADAQLFKESEPSSLDVFIKSQDQDQENTLRKVTAEKEELEAKNEDLETQNEELETKNEELEAKKEQIETKMGLVEAENTYIKGELTELKAAMTQIEKKSPYYGPFTGCYTYEDAYWRMKLETENNIKQ